MGVVAAALTSCGSEPDRRCVDRNDYDPSRGYEIIDDKYCESGGSGTGASWYYGSKGRNGRTGDDGSFSRSEAVDRGGFGCSASGGG
jgi:hypothetical protein